MLSLAKACIALPIEKILALPDVKERIAAYTEQNEASMDMLRKYAGTEGRAIIVDLRGVDPISVGNRFLIYTLFPEQNISVFIVDGKNRQNVAITVGYSIINRGATVNVGSLLLNYGGGGHTQVGTCQVDYAEADRVIREIIDAVK
jgi:nanoRNase/pAp phosphatase (c-di-AMP/oligoRNAs hydrolase)